MTVCRFSLRLWLSLVALFALFALSGFQSRALLVQRAGFGRVSHHSLEAERIPPALAFVNVALGSFRGTLADLLWLRAQQLQEAGRYVELVPLAEGIATLEPDNGEIWAYHAWNLAFNVCAMMGRPEDRWRWVLAGIDLLEKRGMRLNPDDARVRHELSWIFQFKLGSDIDRAAGFYRTQWARTMEAYLEPGGHPPRIPSEKASALQEEYALEAEKMHAIDERMGPLDWRVPAAHAVYWGLDALDCSTEKERLQSRRYVYQPLIQMIQHSGRIVGDPQDPDYNGQLAPNTSLLAGTRRFLLETCQEHPSRGVRAAMIGFLIDSIRIEKYEGKEARARAAYEELVAWFEPETSLPSFEEVLAGKVDFGTLPWTELVDFPESLKEGL